MISFSGSHFRLPLLLRVSDKRVEPLPESEYSAPLRFQLADFAPRDNFVWADRCYKMAQLWAPELALSTDWCVSQGQLGGQQIVQHVDKAKWKSKTVFKDTVIDMERYKGNVDTLKIVDNDIRYKADSFVFNVAGAPEEVKQFSGISRPESTGTLVQCAAQQRGDHRVQGPAAEEIRSGHYSESLRRQRQSPYSRTRWPRGTDAGVRP